MKSKYILLWTRTTFKGFDWVGPGYIFKFSNDKLFSIVMGRKEMQESTIIYYSNDRKGRQSIRHQNFRLDITLGRLMEAYKKK